MRKSLGIFLLLLVVVIFTAQVFAEGGRRSGRGRQQATAAIPQSKNIATAMNDVEWGWNHKKLISHFTNKLRKMYSPLLGKATDAMTEDRLRREMNARIARIKNSYVEFTGRRTGWDTSLLRNEYTHNNGESLVEVRELRASGADPRYTDYFFFINDHLWRRYRAFNQDQFSGIPFESAAVSFQKRFGTAREKRSNGQLVGLEWQDANTRLEAVDNTEFFGVFCLVFSEKATERRIASLRKNKAAKQAQLNPLVEALGETDSHDRHSNVVEHITGKRYQTARDQEGVEDSSGRKQPRRSSKARPALEEPSRPRSKSSGDPLLDLEI